MKSFGLFAYYESYFPPNLIYLRLKVHVYSSVIMCSVRHMSKNTPAICYTSAIFKAIKEHAIPQTNKNLLFYGFWTDLMRPGITGNAAVGFDKSPQCC